MKDDRHRRILELLEEHGQISVAELQGTLGVSDMTVRRDLQELERSGLLRRVHGGATRSLGRAYEPPFLAREGRDHPAKQAIAAHAARLVEDGDAIALDVGSTVLAMVGELVPARQLTVVTASLRVAFEVTRHHALEKDLRLIMSGGIVRAEELSMTGQAAADSYRSYRVDKAFVGVGGIDPAEGATEYNVEDTEVKRAMIRSARQVVVLADASKLGRMCFVEVARTEDIDVLVTDDRADAELLRGVESRGVEVHAVASAPALA